MNRDIEKLGGFPDLTSLMDLFMMWDEEIPVSCYEGGMVLAMKDLDPKS